MQTNKPFVGLHVDETQTSHANDTHVYCQVKPNGNRHTKKKVNIQTERRSHAGEQDGNGHTKKKRNTQTKSTFIRIRNHN